MSLDITKPVKTRDGRKVRILCDDLEGDKSIAAAITNYDGKEIIESYYICGSFSWSTKSGIDIVNTEICNRCGSFIEGDE